ncbi:hypothetical protein [Nocardia puris]|uniref:Uncharacterized protein n=1 Tax=Nocardia puris TaxID=208602 RepID=A0A366CT40_9NOCA|nr:hypothetical protein [Nocardia puris]RBO78522.1 hypothetical protein DFR74_1402 [Nocardia puris]
MTPVEPTPRDTRAPAATEPGGGVEPWDATSFLDTLTSVNEPAVPLFAGVHEFLTRCRQHLEDVGDEPRRHGIAALLAVTRAVDNLAWAHLRAVALGRDHPDAATAWAAVDKHTALVHETVTSVRTGQRLRLPTTPP